MRRPFFSGLALPARRRDMEHRASGPLNGLMVGGGAQYRGPGLITYRVATDGRPVYTDAYTQANAMIAYGLKLSRRVDFRVQLNIDNLFDLQDPQPVQGASRWERRPCLCGTAWLTRYRCRYRAGSP